MHLHARGIGILGSMAAGARSQAYMESTTTTTTTSRMSHKARGGSRAGVKKTEEGFYETPNETRRNKRTSRRVRSSCRGGRNAEGCVSYRRRIRWSRSGRGRIPADRRRCSHRVGADRGGCTRSCKGWALKKGRSPEHLYHFRCEMSLFPCSEP